MNKNLLLVLGAIVLLALGYFFFANKGSLNTGLPGTGGPKTLAQLLGGDNQMCTYEDPETGDSGTFYVAGGSMRGDVTSTTDGKTETNHMIFMDGYMYIWMDGETTGFKTATDFEGEEEADTADINGDTETSTTFDTQKELDYNCSSWRVDSSKFTLPEGVEFMDFSQYTQPAAPASGNGATYDTSTQCAACESLDADSKAQCKVALGC